MPEVRAFAKRVVLPMLRVIGTFSGRFARCADTPAPHHASR
jgi:hypothetical protein